MSGFFFGNAGDLGIDATIISLIVTMVVAILIAIWQSTENKRTQNRLIGMARYYELRTALINLGFIFSGGDKRIQQNEENRKKFVKELGEYQKNVEKNIYVENIEQSINQHPPFSGESLHHCKQCHQITEPILEILNDSKYQNPNHHYNLMKFEVKFDP